MSTLSGKTSLAGDSLGSNGRGIPGGPHCLPANAPDLTPAQMRATLRDAFETIRGLYLRAGADKVSVTKLKVEDWVRDKPRHFAACRTDGSTILLSSELALLPSKNMGAIIAHEFGHAMDYLYPGCFLLTRQGTLDVRASGRRSNQGIPKERYAYWENRSDDAVEATADAIAERVLGVKIGYCGPCNLQTLLIGAADERGCTRPRPTGLR